MEHVVHVQVGATSEDAQRRCAFSPWRSSCPVAWGRLWGSAATAIRTTPLCLLLRADLEGWTAIAKPFDTAGLGTLALAIYDVLRTHGAMFPQELVRRTALSSADFDEGLGELVAAGISTCDHFGALRALVVPSSRRWLRDSASGRWSFFRRQSDAGANTVEDPCERVVRQLLRRTGVVFRKTIVREKLPFGWRELLSVLRTLEARGEVRGGRFVAGFDGEQYALPEAVTLLRSVRRREPRSPIHVSAADPLNYRGILTPEERVSPMTRGLVLLA